MDISEYKILFEKKVKEWTDANSELVSSLAPEAIQALADLMIIMAIPDDAITPKLNNLRMKKSAELLKYAADQKDVIQELQDSMKRAVIEFLREAGTLILKGLLV